MGNPGALVTISSPVALVSDAAPDSIAGLFGTVIRLSETLFNDVESVIAILPGECLLNFG